MIQRKFCALYFCALVIILTSSWAFAQDVQKVTITVDEIDKTKLSFEPKTVTVKPGKVEFTLVNKGKVNHNLAIKVKDKITRIIDRATVGESPKSEPFEVSAGEYEIFCDYKSGGLHRERGMAGKLVVK